MEPSRELKLSEEPIAWTLSTSKLNSYCSYCLKQQQVNSEEQTGCRLLRCSKCKVLYYCNSTCQKNDWSTHKLECKRICHVSSLGLEIPDDWIRLFCRIYDLLSRKTFESEGRTFNDLVSHDKNIDTHEFEIFLDRFSSFVSLTDEESLKLDKKNLLSMYGKIKVNAFGIKNSELQSIGIGLYLHLSRLDHSCNPNGRIFYKGREATVVNVHGEVFKNL